MFYKYLLEQKHLNKIKKIPIESFSYTRLIEEPSLLHSHDNCEIIVALNNEGYVLCNNQKVKLSKNDILIVNTSVSHTEKNDGENSSFEYYSLRLNITISMPNYDYKILNSSKNDQLIFYLNSAYKNLNENDENIAVLNLTLFYLNFQKKMENESMFISMPSNDFVPYYISDAKNYILKNYSKKISINELAEKYNISETLFCNKFKYYLKMTPNEFIIRTRIDYSKNLLLTTNYSISQIATLCGFNSPAYFTKTFKEITKILPKHYRDNE